MDVRTNDIDPQSTVFEWIHLQNKLLEVVEELRLRRKSEVENDVKIKTLLEEKYNAESYLEDLKKESVDVKDNYEHLIIELKKEFEVRFLQVKEEKAKAVCAVKTLTQEVKVLKEETKAFQLNKLEYEKKVRDLENRLHLHLNIQEATNEELTRLRLQQEVVATSCKKLGDAQLHLNNSVQQALAKQGKLDGTILQQRELLNELECKNGVFQQEIIALRSQSAMNVRTNNFDTQSTEFVQLQSKVQMQDEDIRNLQHMIVKLREENDENLKELSKSSALFHHCANSNTVLELAKLDVTAKLEDATTSLAKVEKELENASCQLDFYRERCKLLEENTQTKATRDVCVQISELSVNFAMEVDVQNDVCSQEEIYNSNSPNKIVSGHLQSNESDFLDLSQDKMAEIDFCGENKTVNGDGEDTASFIGLSQNVSDTKKDETLRSPKTCDNSEPTTSEGPLHKWTLESSVKIFPCSNEKSVNDISTDLP